MTKIVLLLALFGVFNVVVAVGGLVKVPITSTLVLKSIFPPKTVNAPTSNAAVKVIASVQAGDGQTFGDVLVDTGSAILWVTGYNKGPYTKVINQTFSVGYGAGGVNGTAYLDRVTIGGASVQSQIIGSASFLGGFTLVEPIDGILGLGPHGSNGQEVSGFNTTPTFVENLVTEGVIDEPIFGVYVSKLGEGEGEITFGGVDYERIRGEVAWIEQNPPLDFHWEFNVSAFSFGNTQYINTPTFARSDTGVLTIGIPIDSLFSILQTTNATIDFTSQLAGCLVFPSSDSSTSLPPITISVAGLDFLLPSSQYIVPKELYTSLNITADSLNHSWLCSAGPGEFMLGQKWLEGVYTAYDMKNHRVGFAHLATDLTL